MSAVRFFRLLVIVGFLTNFADSGYSQPPAAVPAKTVAQLEAEIRRLQTENATLKAALAEHGIDLGVGYSSLAQMLGELPPELKPSKWDKYTFDKAVEHLNRELVGEKFTATLVLSGVTTNKRASDWHARFYFNSREFKHDGKSFVQEVGGGWPQQLTLDGDEEFAKRIDRMKPGQRVRVTGRIRSVRIGPEQNFRREGHIGLNEAEVLPE